MAPESRRGTVGDVVRLPGAPAFDGAQQGFPVHQVGLDVVARAAAEPRDLVPRLGQSAGDGPAEDTADAREEDAPAVTALLATVYTSGEHCPMCAAAHAWVGLGRIVYVASSEQLTGWLAELGVPAAPVRARPVQEVAPGVAVEGPVPELTDEVRALHFRFHGRRS